jgi:adenosylcobyric acid synthase
MVLGTGSHAGKSLVATALCRLLSDFGVRVAPFKAQNMALNSGVTVDGFEIGRAQMLQAQAARCPASKHMNPVLLKPMGGRGSQVIVQGRARGIFSTRQYFKFWPEAVNAAKLSYEALAGEYEALVIEGAGSPAEVNLAHRDLANIETARFSKAPWILVTDIERGGSFASILGTLKLVPAWMRPRLIGVVFNKFRGDPRLLDSGLRWLWKKHKVRTLGILPWLDDLNLDQEDSLGLPVARRQRAPGALCVELLLLDSFSNFSEFAVLQQDPGISLAWRKPGTKGMGAPDLLVIPGSKRTLEDMRALHSSGEAKRIRGLAKQGTWILGICGGLQMLGNTISDASGVDGVKRARVTGLGLLPSLTRMEAQKITAQSACVVETKFGKFELSGYEIHHGRTHLQPGSVECAQKAFPDRPMLAQNQGGRIWGSYLHGLLDNDAFRHAFLRRVASAAGKRYASHQKAGVSGQDKEIQRFAGHVAKHLRLDLIKGFPR